MGRGSEDCSGSTTVTETRKVTVMVPVTQEHVGTRDVCKTEWVDEVQKYTVMVPETVETHWYSQRLQDRSC